MFADITPYFYEWDLGCSWLAIPHCQSQKMGFSSVRKLADADLCRWYTISREEYHLGAMQKNIWMVALNEVLAYPRISKSAGWLPGRERPVFTQRRSTKGCHSSPCSNPFLMDSTGRNCICLWGCEAPEWSPELKNPNNSSPSAWYDLKQSYAVFKSASSSKCVCSLNSFVARMKWSGMTGNLLRTRLYEPNSATSNCFGGSRNGSNGFWEVSLGLSDLGLCAKAGE